jgi:hypothetical protein
MGDRRYSSKQFYPLRRTEVSGQLRRPLYTRGAGTLVPIGYDAGWASENKEEDLSTSSGSNLNNLRH